MGLPGLEAGPQEVLLLPPAAAPPAGGLSSSAHSLPLAFVSLLQSRTDLVFLGAE